MSCRIFWHAGFFCCLYLLVWHVACARQSFLFIRFQDPIFIVLRACVTVCAYAFRCAPML